MTTYGITSTGFVIKTLLEIEEEINNAYKADQGTSINTRSQSAYGLLRDLVADGEGDLWDKINDVYNQLTILATGQNLDLVAALSGKRRIESTQSMIKDFQFTVSGNLSLSAGTLFSKSDETTTKYSLDEALSYTYVGPGNETTTADVTCTTYGVVSVNDDSITVIDSPTANLVSVTNPVASTFVQGRAEETDEELRERIQNDPFITVTGTDSGLRRAVMALNDIENSGFITIENCFVIPNRNLYADADARPGKSTEVIVYYVGAPDADTDHGIALALINAAPDPTNFVTTTGSSYSEDVELDGGNTRTVVISRPTAVPIYVDIDVTTADGATTADEKTALKTAIAAWGNALGVSQDIIVYGRDSLSEVLNDFVTAELTDYEIGVAITPAPTPGTDDSNITIDYTEISTWTVGNINIGDL